MNQEKEPDIVQLILAACQAEGFDPSIASMIEKKICEQYGGQRVYIHKKNRLTDQERKQVFNEGLSSKSTKQITDEQGISRATLYRLMKKGN